MIIISNEIKLLDDWFYKPSQLVEIMASKDVDKEEVAIYVNTFQTKAMNLFIQEIHNRFLEDKDYDTNSDLPFKIDLERFLEKTSMDVSSISNIRKEVRSLARILVEPIQKTKVSAISLFPSIELDLKEGYVSFSANNKLINTIKNEYKPMWVEDTNHKHKYVRANFDAYKGMFGLRDVKTIKLYEFLLKNSFLLENGYLITKDISDLMIIMNCGSYKKTSDIINKAINPSLERLRELLGLKIYYFCTTKPTNSKITSISFKIFFEEGLEESKKYLHSKSETDSKIGYLYKEEPEYLDGEFKFKNQEYYERLLKLKITNIPKNKLANFKEKQEVAKGKNPFQEIVERFSEMPNPEVEKNMKDYNSKKHLYDEVAQISELDNALENAQDYEYMEIFGITETKELEDLL